MDESLKISFLDAATNWLCDSYSAEVRYLAKRDDQRLRLLEASIVFSPLLFNEETSFHIETPFLIAGQSQYNQLSTEQALDLLQRATTGEIFIQDELFAIGPSESHYFDSNMLERDRWFNELHLGILGEGLSNNSPSDHLAIDNLLRLNTPPFDGVSGLTSWLGLPDPFASSKKATIDLKILSPVDFHECNLLDGCLSITLNAHTKFDKSKLSLAVITIPGDGLNSRQQLSSEFKWGRAKAGVRKGIAKIRLDQADSVLVILMVGTSMVRRQWVLDPSKARNGRLLAVREFDKDLRMIRRAVLNPENGSDFFERGLAALLFLLGFSPMVQVETDAPDIVAMTPGGVLVLVECTLKIADFNAKLGKLVDRRSALVNALSSSGHQARVDAVLVCALPEDRIAKQQEVLVKHQVVLITKEQLESAFDRVHFPSSPDQLLDEARAQMNLPRGIR